MVFGTVLGRAVTHAVELEAFECFDDLFGVEGAGHFNGVGIQQGLHVGCVSGLRRGHLVHRAERLHKVLRGCVGQLPVPVCGTENALNGVASTLCHQLREQRHHDFEFLTVGLLVAQPELNGLCQRVDHVLTVVVQDQDVGARVQNRGDVLREVGGAQRRTHGVDRFPARGFGRCLHRLFLCPAPGVVGGQVIGTTLFTVFLGEDRPECLARHVGVEEVAEAIALLVFACRVIRVGQGAHVDHPHLLRQPLQSNRFTRGGAAGEHCDAILFDHAFAERARCVGLGLSVACHVLDFLAEDAVPFESKRFHRFEHAAIAFAVDMLDGEFVGPKFICTFVSVSSGLRYGEPKFDCCTLARVIAEIVSPGILHIERRRNSRSAEAGD